MHIFENVLDCNHDACTLTSEWLTPQFDPTRSDKHDLEAGPVSPRGQGSRSCVEITVGNSGSCDSNQGM